MTPGVNPKDFVGKGLPDGGHVLKVENNLFETIQPCRQVSGLRSGDLLLAIVPGQFHGYLGEVEPQTAGIAGMAIKHALNSPRGFWGESP